MNTSETLLMTQLCLIPRCMRVTSDLRVLPDADTPLDVWTVIKPGHVREKIAIFVSERGREDSAGGGECAANSRDRAPEADLKVSVVDMVAFLEQRVSEQQLDSKPVLALQRSCTTIMLSRAPPTKLRDGSEHRGEEPESIRVSDMVARLESECLRRRAEGNLSRSNSLRRTAGRVLLAAVTGHSSTPSQPASPSSPAAQCLSREPVGCLPASALTTPLSGELVKSEEAAGVERECTVTETHLKAPPSEEEEPVPGLLFFNPASAPLVWRASASQDFLEKRQRLQQLLEPQPYLTALPHHLLVKIFLLLPTQSLAALKCACSYFKFIIENYGVRPADSLWVSDPRYRDDPCKQCKKRYGRGDVSLCRWHHKPYCQALPYGPGYWMCCHGARRDTPGCNVGLHDNRWVPGSMGPGRGSHGGVWFEMRC
uniref:F-box protein 34 n=1 Tax=Pundamilia nyererei TaxID=303518 RepID=A0A3B4FJC0_9CICH